MDEFLTFLLLAIGLSFDSFAVSVSCGIMRNEIRFKQAVVIAFFLALFQAAFPVLGWLVGISLSHLISGIDHWIAFFLLLFIGLRMIMEGIRKMETIKDLNPLKFKVMIGLAIATSIDALAVGISFGFLEIHFIYPVLIIGIVTFLAAMLGMLFGKHISGEKSHRSIIIGGIILILIGLKILIEHIGEIQESGLSILSVIR